MKEGEEKFNILYIAFSCQPNKGSEEKIGWNIPLESSKINNVFVFHINITFSFCTITYG